jgi:type IV pilus assembly protein PilC
VDLKTRDEVMAYLHRQKLIPVAVREKPKEFSISFGTGVKTREIVIFTRQFATMINAGLPLVQSLDILAEQTENPKLQKVIQEVLYDVESGNTLADAMEKHPKVFTKLFVSMVSAGEAGGILDTILLRLATFLEKNDALARKIKGAMIYPGVILGVAVAAVAILLIFVIPTFQTMFASAGVPLPLPTQIVISMSALLQAWWWAMLLAIGAALFALRSFYRRRGGSGRWTASSSSSPSWGTCSGRPPWRGSPGPWGPWSPRVWPSWRGWRSRRRRRETGSSRMPSWAPGPPSPGVRPSPAP